MKTALWCAVLALATLPWWSVPLTSWLTGRPLQDCMQAMAATIVAIWTPSVVLVALLLARRR